MNSATHVVLYDDGCPLCTFQMKMLTWLDWRGVLSMVPLSRGRLVPAVAHIDRAALIEAIHCVTRKGIIHRGARAIRFMSLRLPLAIPAALILYIPGVIWLAERAYAGVSRNRHLLSRFFGCKEACSLLPTRERDNETRYDGL